MVAVDRLVDKFKSWFKHSLTILWARTVAVGGFVVAALLNLSSDPAVNAAIQQLFQPQYVPYWIIAIGIVTELARRRTAGQANEGDKGAGR